MARPAKKGVFICDGDGRLYKRTDRPSQNWYVQVRLATGEWRSFTTGESDLEKAKSKGASIVYRNQARITEGLPVATRKFKSVANMVIARLLEQEMAGTFPSAQSYRIAIEKYLIPTFGDLDIHNVRKHLDRMKPKRIEIYNQVRRTEDGTKIDMSQSSLENHRSALNHVMDFAQERGYIEEHHKPKVSIRKQGRRPEPRPYFDPHEWQRLAQLLHSPEWLNGGPRQITKMKRALLREFVLIVRNTGMRVHTETSSLKWNSIFEYRAPDKKTGQMIKYLIFAVPKGKVGTRYLVAKHTVRRYLKRLKEQSEELRKLSWKELNKLDRKVFLLPNGEEVADGGLQQCFKQFLIKYGLRKDPAGKNRSLYSLRHTYISNHILAGLSENRIADNVGTSVDMIHKYYNHVDLLNYAYLFGGEPGDYYDSSLVFDEDLEVDQGNLEELSDNEED